MRKSCACWKYGRGENYDCKPFVPILGSEFWENFAGWTKYCWPQKISVARAYWYGESG